MAQCKTNGDYDDLWVELNKVMKDEPVQYIYGKLYTERRPLGITPDLLKNFEDKDAGRSGREARG